MTRARVIRPISSFTPGRPPLPAALCAVRMTIERAVHRTATGGRRTCPPSQLARSLLISHLTLYAFPSLSGSSHSWTRHCGIYRGRRGGAACHRPRSSLDDQLYTCPVYTNINVVTPNHTYIVRALQ